MTTVHAHPAETGFEPDSTAAVSDWRSRLRHSRLGTWLVLLATTALVVAGAWLAGPRSASPATTDAGTGGGANGGPVVGQPAPDLTARAADGSQVSLAALKGHPVWLTFGASWCAECRAETPDIQAAQATATALGAKVIAVQESEDQATVAAWASTMKLSYPHVPDPTASLGDAWRVLGVPTHYFIDAQGVLRQIDVGALTPAQMKQRLTALSGSAR